MATMTTSEACYIYDLISTELQDETHRHHPFSALKGYDVFQLCVAFKLVIANEFLMFAGRDDFEKKLASGVELYEGILAGIPLYFVADEQIDTPGADSTFLWNDPRYRSQETPSSFAEYCKSLGADDPLYWQKVYERLELEYTSASPKANDVQPTECDFDDSGIRDHFHSVVFEFSDSTADESPHIGDCSILPHPKKTILYAIRWVMNYWESQRETTNDQAIIDRYNRLAPMLSYLLTHLARDWHQIEPVDKDAVAKLNKCESFPDWALPLKAKYIDEDTSRNEALDIALEVAKDRIAFEKKRGGLIVSSGQLESTSAMTTSKQLHTPIKTLGIIVAKLIAVGMLFGALGHRQYDYYTLLRWVVCCVVAFGAFRASEVGKKGWAWTLGIAALFFNPIIPVHLTRETWAFVDLIAAVTLLISVVAVDFYRPPRTQDRPELTDR